MAKKKLSINHPSISFNLLNKDNSNLTNIHSSNNIKTSYNSGFRLRNSIPTEPKTAVGAAMHTTYTTGAFPAAGGADGCDPKGIT